MQKDSEFRTMKQKGGGAFVKGVFDNRCRGMSIENVSTENF